MFDGDDGRANLISADILEIKNQYLQLAHDDTKDLQLLLLDMGYNLNMINMVFCFYSVNEIDQAINYMSQIDGVWQHHYTSVDNTCIICGENTPHIDHETPMPQDIENDKEYRQVNQLRISRSFVSNPEEEFSDELCSICYTNNLTNDLNLSIKCKHDFCLECWERYVTEAIQTGKVLPINCMSNKCTMELTEADILMILGGDEKSAVFEKYKKFLKRRQNELSESTKHCPIRDCEGFGKKEKDGTKYIKCENGHKFCYECLKPWHGQKSCEEIIDKDFFRWKKTRIIKKCPNCFLWTEKNEGCNHMTCGSCKFQWCWICEQKYTSTHFSSGPCQGLQFNAPIVADTNSIAFKITRLFNKFMYFYFAIGILLLTSAFGASFGGGLIVFIIYLDGNDFDSCLIHFCLVIMGGFAGCILQPYFFIIAGGIATILFGASILFPPMICYINDAIRDM